MEIRVEVGDIAQHPAKAIIVNLFQGVKRPGGGTGAVDRALGGAISQLIDDGETKGKEGELTLIHTLGRLPSPRVLVVGLGKAEEFKLDKVRHLTASALRRLWTVGCDTAATIAHGAGIAGLDAEECAQAIAEGAVMGLYRFDRHKKPDEDQREIKELVLVEFEAGKAEALRRGVERGVVLGQAANHARDMANEPANFLTPTEMAHRAQELAQEASLECQVLEQEQMQVLGMGALLGVAQGSIQPPKMIVLRYRGDPQGDKTIGFLGKGITFDSGGISIKPSGGMEEMKGD
ncbi:MAG: M17 family metallopeptidase, partial [Dehalococcoidia bacterium]